jgi:hypothetical protein
MAIKRFGLFISLLIWGPSALSSFITNDWITEVITGADMSQMHVWAIFEDRSWDRGRWRTQSRVDLPFLEGEGMSGAAFGRRQDWALYQQGYTLGNISEVDGRRLGAWTLYNNTGRAMTRLIISGLSGGILFDTLPGDSDSLGGVGRAFTPFPGSLDVTAYYRWPVEDEMFGRLVIDFDDVLSGDNGMMQFWADTDKIGSVPEPSTILLVGTGLIGMLFSRKRKA